jgi:hypothetical protein
MKCCLDSREYVETQLELPLLVDINQSEVTFILNQPLNNLPVQNGEVKLSNKLRPRLLGVLRVVHGEDLLVELFVIVRIKDIITYVHFNFPVILVSLPPLAHPNESSECLIWGDGTLVKDSVAIFSVKCIPVVNLADGLNSYCTVFLIQFHHRVEAILVHNSDFVFSHKLNVLG